MESIIKYVRDIGITDKLALEHSIGQQLPENQQVTIQICNLDQRSETSPTGVAGVEVTAGRNIVVRIPMLLSRNQD